MIALGRRAGAGVAWWTQSGTLATGGLVLAEEDAHVASRDGSVIGVVNAGLVMLGGPGRRD
jgi:hypothetical protein